MEEQEQVDHTTIGSGRRKEVLKMDVHDDDRKMDVLVYLTMHASMLLANFLLMLTACS